ncbi:MAG: antibiotic biosynthesis monooxygenase [Gammaproteobacteria bacterium]|nr:antibiotic biosynthesis monooxygenase [Gammaproteobacteria bacterium]NIO26652.1 antibiotic biosynthesis monooxygenase [Gammaproteobacteria bacterium]NIO67205.1 antibiotic biosynthesis monooxygenase [Gammaproteobacteria bacterium]NIP47256.1 antibiotic biosynthesis monooxygenase [Gammaproteobacteria bacterium]NIP66359.1 antibiotic biosynthesis monooxygenase [Gammaproteobacteria bacterium]
MSRFAIIVTIKLQPGKAEEFKPHILANAEAAVRDEPDCHLFHVMQTEDDPDTFIFYEVYTDAASLEVHRQQPHFKKFYEGANHMVADRAVQRVTVHNPDNIA